MFIPVCFSESVCLELGVLIKYVLLYSSETL